MIQLSLPMRVTPVSCTVPQLKVQYSRMVLRSPISRTVASPAYFLSWGGPPRELNPKMRFCAPMRVRPSITTCGPIDVPSPISRSSPMFEYGPTEAPGTNSPLDTTMSVERLVTVATCTGVDSHHRTPIKHSPCPLTT